MYLQTLPDPRSGKTFASLRIAHCISETYASGTTRSMQNKIIILDGSNLKLLNQKLELISNKEFVGLNEPSKPVSLNSMSIYILKNVDTNTKKNIN